jgi:hypothetical protein
MTKKEVTNRGLRLPGSEECCQRHLQRRRWIPLQARAEANPAQNTLRGASHDKAFEIQRGPDLLFYGQSMDQLLRAGKIPAHPRPYRGGLTAHPSTHRRRKQPQSAFHEYSQEDGTGHLQDAYSLQSSLLQRRPGQRSYTTRVSDPASHLQDKRQLPHRVHQVRGGGFRLVVPCHPWQASTSQVHGHAPLYLTATQGARQLLKVPGKTGVLTLHGDLKKSYDCDQEVIEYATTSRVPEPSAEVLAATLKLTNIEMEISNQRPSQSRVKPKPSDVGIRTIQLQEGNPSKTALIRGGLDDK